MKKRRINISVFVLNFDLWGRRFAGTFLQKGSCTSKNLSIGKIKLPHFIIVDGFDFSISGSGYRVARTFSNFDLSFR